MTAQEVLKMLQTELDWCWNDYEEDYREPYKPRPPKQVVDSLTAGGVGVFEWSVGQWWAWNVRAWLNPPTRRSAKGTKSPTVVQVWNWECKSALYLNCDADIRVLYDGRIQKLKTTIKSIASNLAYTSIFRWVNGVAVPVWVVMTRVIQEVKPDYADFPVLSLEYVMKKELKDE